MQGGVDAGLRVESARRTVALGFDGYAVGGLSVGESRDEMLPTPSPPTLAELPGRPAPLPHGRRRPGRAWSRRIALGVDMFDCVLPTRLGRHGTVLTDAGRLNLRNARFADRRGPLDPACPCAVCARWSRGYLRHLLQVGEQTAARLRDHPQRGLAARLVARHGRRDPGRAARGVAGRGRGRLGLKGPRRVTAEGRR